MALIERLHPKGVPFSGFRYMKGKGVIIVEVYERDICHFSHDQLKDQNEISHRRILWM